jgi:hypothetical protein
MAHSNPWLRDTERPVPEDLVEEGSTPIRTVPTTGPTRPQAHASVPAPDRVDQLPLRVPAKHAALWIVGAHGGAGESTIAGLDDLWDEGGHAWPGGPEHEQRAVVIAARSSAHGLLRAQAAAQQWAAGLVPGVTLLGLVVVADAPGKLPKPLRELRQLVAGAYPRVWDLPWIETWRRGGTIAPEAQPRELTQLRKDLFALLSHS